MTTLTEALTLLATRLSLNADALIGYAAEDRIGGFNLDVNQRRWATGSIWEVEGQILYALVRALKPRHVVEIGTWRGCGATHILEALAVNGKGKLTSVDIDANAGAEIPLSLRKRWTFVNAPAQTYLEKGALADVDMVFEDGPHTLDETVEILLAIKTTLTPKIVISHDCAHFLVGKVMCAAYARVYGGCEVTLVEPSDCGFGFVVNHA